MPQLDSLRALAFLSVAASHWLIAKTPLAHLGGPGVQLFFVLSGFLITGILLDYRDTQERSAGLTPASTLRTFYARRFFRIFPLFYGVIAVTALLNIGPIRQFWPWHVSYTSNFLYALHAPSRGDPFSHFWSLAVEEQFYLVWPFLVLFASFVTLRRLIIGMILLAPVFRIVMDYAFPAFHRVNYLPLSCGDSLGVGALLAFASRHEQLFSVPLSRIVRRLGLWGIAGGLSTGLWMLSQGRSFSAETLGHTFLILVFGWIVFQAARGFNGPVGSLLNRPELQFLGKISYGLYVFHHFFTRVNLPSLFNSVGLPEAWAQFTIVQLFCRFTFTFTLAVASWYLYERPLNNLKRHFTLQKKTASRAPSPLPAYSDKIPISS